MGDLFLAGVGKPTYQPHPGQKKIHEDNHRFKVLACGTRWGKDWCSLNEVIKWTAIMLDRERQNPRGLIPAIHGWIVAPDYPLSRQIWRELKYFLPRETWAKEPNESERRLELNGGAVIEVKSADRPESLVAVGLDWLLVTECGLIKSLAWEMSLRPRLSSPRRYGLGIFNGTPKGRNWFYRLFLKGIDPLDPDWKSFHFTTLDSGLVSKKEILRAKADMPERWFRQEFLAEFLEDTNSVFRNIRSLIKTKERKDFSPPFYIGIDLAKYKDFTVISVLDQEGYLVDLDRFTEIDWSIQKERIKSKAREWPGKIILDATGVGDPILEDLLKEGLTIEGIRFTSETKKNLIDALAIAIENKAISYPEIPQLLNELEAFEYELTREGRVKYGAPEGYHDDCVISLALANWGRRSPEAVGISLEGRREWYQTSRTRLL